MDFNQSPYFDDFDSDKQYYKVLFKPGVSVQTREMNQLQSILQDQVTKFGTHVFKEGSMVIPGQVVYNDKVAYVKLASVAGLGSYNISWLEGQTLTTSISGDTAVEAKVIKAIAAVGSDPITLIIVYSSAFQDDFGNNEVAFKTGQTLYVQDNYSYTVTTQGSGTVTGRSSYAAMDSGVYFINGYFVTVPKTVIVVAKYLTNTTKNDINVKIGLTYTESVVNYEADNSLLDNSTGTSNSTAPGADRYKISTDFVLLDLGTDQENFFELIRIEGGVLQNIINASQYNILEETLARRTYDESGNYTVDDFNMEVRESRSNQRGNWNINTRYEVDDYIRAYSGTTVRYFACAQAGVSGTGSIPPLFATADETATISDGSVVWRYAHYLVSNRGYYDANTSTVTLGNSSQLVLGFGPGKAYIQGFQVDRLEASVLRINKARETKTENNRSIVTQVGNYTFFNPTKTWGLPDVTVGPIVYFYDKAIPDPTVLIPYGNLIGRGRLMYMDKDSNGAYRTGFANVTLNAGKSFERDVNMMAIPDPAKSTLFKTFAATGGVKYVGPYDSAGLTFQTSSYVQISGGLATLANTSQVITHGVAYTLVPQTMFGGNLFYSASTGNTAWTYASSAIQVRGYQSAFSKELQVGDIITTRSSSNASVSSWTVVTINSDTSMVISGGPIFNKYTSTGWSSTVQGGPIRNWSNTQSLSGFTVSATGVGGTEFTLLFAATAGVTWSLDSSSAYATTAGGNNPLQLGSIISFYNTSTGAIGSDGRTAIFIEQAGVPDNGYSSNLTWAASAGATTTPWADDRAVSSYMITAFLPNGFKMKGSAWCSGTGTVGASIVVLLRGAQHAVVPAAFNATTSYISMSTSAYVNLQAGTVFGVGTGTSTRFKAEFVQGQPLYIGGNTSSAYATRVNSVISNNRMILNYSTTSLTAWTSLSLINTNTATVTTALYGAWYTGTAVAFASEIFDNYALGVNSKKLSGMHQLLRYDGTAGIVAQHTAALIQGDLTARFTQELQPNDLVKINDVRLFITQISSNSQAYGLVWDGAITTTTASYPATRISNTLRDAERKTLVFKVADNATRTDLKDNSYSVYESQNISGLTPGVTSQFVVNLTGATGALNAESLPTVDTGYFLVAENTVGTLSKPLTVINVSLVGTQATITLSAPVATSTVRVIYPVKKSAVSATQLGGVRTKTLNFNGTATFLTSSTATKGKLSLGNADIYRIVKIMQATSFVAVWDATAQATATDVTDKYWFDDGQTSMFYDIGSAVLRPSRAVPTGSIKIWYEYFDHGTGDFFSYASYNPLQVPKEKIKNLNGVSLADAIDFRSKVDATTNLLINSNIPRQGSTFDTDLGYYLGRKTGILLDRRGIFHAVDSASAITPKEPDLSGATNSLQMWSLTLSPYTATIKPPDLYIRYFDNRRYTMKDIGAIERRVNALEEITSLSLLENKTNSLQIRDNNDPTLERYKSGFFVDNFTDATNLFNTGDVNCNIDTTNRIMYPRTITTQVGLVEKINYSGAILSSLEQSPQVSARKTDNYKTTGQIISIDYTTTAVLTQLAATTSILVAPFFKLTFLGSMTLTPDSDIFTSVASTKDNQVTSADVEALSAANLAAAQAGKATSWVGGSGHYEEKIIDAGSENVLVSQEITQSAIPYCRANTILIRATGMKPNTKYYTFCDQENISANVQPAVKLTLNELEILDFKTSRPDPTAWAKWRQVNESVWLQEKQANGADVTVRRTKTPGSDATEQLLPDAARGDAYRSALAPGASVYYYYNGAYRGSAVAVNQDATTIYCVNTRGQLADSYIRAGTKVNGIAQQSYPGNFYVGVDQNDPKVLSSGIIKESDILGFADGSLQSDAKGNLVALFDLPDTDIKRILTGSKVITFTTSAVNDPDDWESKATAVYTSQGFALNIVNNYVSIRSYAKRAYDPIAQSFKLPDQFTSGAFITDIDVFMARKPAKAGVPLTLDLRLCDATGRPSGTDMIPNAIVDLYSNDITVDEKYGQAATKFTFNEPVYLSPGKNYAFVLRSDDQNYFAWAATLGQADVKTPTLTYSAQAVLGSLFRSQDGTLWSEDQTTDLKFQINRAVFKTNVNATARVVNTPMPAVNLPINPFMLVHGSNKIRVYHPSHGLAKGDFVRYHSEYWSAQYAVNPSATIGGIPLTQIFGPTITTSDIIRPTDTQLQVSAVDIITKDYYIVQVTTPANLGVNQTTGVSSINSGGLGVIASKNSLYHVIKPGFKSMSFQETTLSFSAEQTNGFTYDGILPSTSGTPYARTSTPLDINKLNYLDTPASILSSNNEYSRHAGGTVVSGTGSQTWKESFIGKFDMVTTNDAVSPIIDLSSMQLEILQHAIDNPSKAVRLPSTLPVIGSAVTGDTLFVDYEPIIQNDLTIVMDGIAESITSTVPNAFDGVVPGSYITISGSSVPGNNSTSSPVLVAGVSDDKQTIYLSSNLTTIDAGDPVSIYFVRDYIEESGTVIGSTESKYTTKIISLTNPATSIKLVMDINVPSAAAFDVYYKTGTNVADFDSINWDKFEQLPVYKKDDIRFNFTELTVNITDFDSAGNTRDLPDFTAFQLKIVMRSTNAARPPMFKNLRAIAHA